MRMPATAKLNELAMNAASRPKTTVNTAPSAAPIASMAPHVDAMSAVASGRSFLSTRLGSAAFEAGAKNAPSAAIVPCATKAIHTRPGPTSRKPSAATAWIDDAITSTLRRSNRSATVPASGVTKNAGRLCATKTIAAAKLESVRSSTSPSTATVANQSPMYEMTCAVKSVRKSRLRRRSESIRREAPTRARDRPPSRRSSRAAPG